jgi:hypothetical protein
MYVCIVLNVEVATPCAPCEGSKSARRAASGDTLFRVPNCETRIFQRDVGFTGSEWRQSRGAEGLLGSGWLGLCSLLFERYPQPRLMQISSHFNAQQTNHYRRRSRRSTLRSLISPSLSLLKRRSEQAKTIAASASHDACAPFCALSS